MATCVSLILIGHLMVALGLITYVRRPSFLIERINWAAIMKIITNLTSKEHMSFDIAIVTDTARTHEDIKISRIKRLHSDKLFTNVKEVMIDHENETYILRVTKQNKLILTK